MPNAKSSLRLLEQAAHLAAMLVLAPAGAWMLWHGGSEGLKLLHDSVNTSGDAAAWSLTFAVTMYLPMVALGVFCLVMAGREYRLLRAPRRALDDD